MSDFYIDDAEIYRRLYIEAGTAFHNVLHNGSTGTSTVEQCDIQCCAEVARAKEKRPQTNETLQRLFKDRK